MTDRELLEKAAKAAGYEAALAAQPKPEAAEPVGWMPIETAPAQQKEPTA